MPASGKSTIAKKLAILNKAKLFDTDNYIEEKYQLKISEIFDKFGENKFRKFERCAIKDIINNENIIVATGGGLPCFYDNMQFMNNIGKTIYLNVSAKTLQKRLLKDKNTRPLIKGKSSQEILEYLRIYLKEREPFYKQAHFIIDAEKSIEEQINIINSLIKNL